LLSAEETMASDLGAFRFAEQKLDGNHCVERSTHHGERAARKSRDDSDSAARLMGGSIVSLCAVFESWSNIASD